MERAIVSLPLDIRHSFRRPIALLALHHGTQQRTTADKQWVSVGNAVGSHPNAREAVEIQLPLETGVLVQVCKEVGQDALLKFGLLVNLKTETAWRERGHICITAVLQFDQHLI